VVTALKGSGHRTRVDSGSFAREDWGRIDHYAMPMQFARLESYTRALNKRRIGFFAKTPHEAILIHVTHYERAPPLR